MNLFKFSTCFLIILRAWNSTLNQIDVDGCCLDLAFNLGCVHWMHVIEEISQLKLSLQVAVAAKDKLQVFKIESKKMKNSPLRSSRQENGIKQSSLGSSSLQSEENNRVLKPNQDLSDEESNLGYTEGQHFDSTGPALSEAYLRSGRCKIPGLRRTRLPWTRVEEEVLKVNLYFLFLNSQSIHIYSKCCCEIKVLVRSEKLWNSALPWAIAL